MKSAKGDQMHSGGTSSLSRRRQRYLADSMAEARADGSFDITAEQAIEAIDAIRHGR
jgi:hypothetical protein